MTNKKLPTEPYKGVRDFYPEEMAIQQYIFDTWSKTAESFGFEQYGASVLEPADMYKAKEAENEELINDQTYTFTDRGDREVTLRPEMTPTAARMVAARHRELSFPLRWYSIPNLFRYERPQRGRLREHWQLNCDMFGINDVSSDVEIISLAYNTLIAFGATPDMFEVRLSDRAWVTEFLYQEGLSEDEINPMLALLDRKEKIDNFEEEVIALTGKDINFDIKPEAGSNLTKVITQLKELGIDNVKVSLSTVRGFNYYTGTIFEIFDISGENNRSLIGGGRYDNLTGLFSNESISGVGFGKGEVTMKDFLKTHNLLPDSVTKTVANVMVAPMDTKLNLEAQKISQKLRESGQTVSIDFSSKKVEKKIASAKKKGYSFVIVVGEDEISSGTFTAKNLDTEEQSTGTLPELAVFISK